MGRERVPAGRVLRLGDGRGRLQGRPGRPLDRHSFAPPHNLVGAGKTLLCPPAKRSLTVTTRGRQSSATYLLPFLSRVTILPTLALHLSHSPFLPFPCISFFSLQFPRLFRVWSTPPRRCCTSLCSFADSGHYPPRPAEPGLSPPSCTRLPPVRPPVSVPHLHSIPSASFDPVARYCCCGEKLYLLSLSFFVCQPALSTHCCIHFRSLDCLFGKTRA